MTLLPLVFAITVDACTALGGPVIEHACIHGKAGPFGDGVQPHPLPTSAASSFTGAAPNVNAPHTLFTLALTAAGSEHTGSVKFVPRRSGSWGTFTAPAAQVAVRRRNGAPVLPHFSHPTPSCATLQHVSVWPLEAQEVYTLTVVASVPEVKLVMERAEEFSLLYFPDADGDGHGDPDVLVETACVPPANHVEGDTDCDDIDPLTHPGAPEFCNGRDNNCNGLIDGGCVPPPDGGVVDNDAGVAIDARPLEPADAGLEPSLESMPEGGGCTFGASGSERSGGPIVLTVLLVAVLSLRRRW